MGRAERALLSVADIRQVATIDPDLALHRKD
jgi:hypothetical protein